MENPMPSFLHYFLRRAGIRIDLLRLRAVYDRHPLPHSIRSLSDTLDELCIPNMICRLEFDQLSELDGPFLVVSAMPSIRSNSSSVSIPKPVRCASVRPTTG